jgi:aminoacylase
LNPPPQGSETYPDYHSFDHLIEGEKFPLSDDDNYTIQLFKDFVKIPSITGDGPNGPSQKCVDFLAQICDKFGIKWKTMEFTPKYPIFFAEIPGQDETLPAILLNSHFDVVPVIPSKWVYPPFEAIELDNGDIVGRGTQDMKCVVIQHFIGIITLLQQVAAAKGIESSLTSDSKQPALGQLKLLKRTVYLSVMPDEEMGGPNGMAKWAYATEPDHEKGLIPAKDLNIGFTLDEGLASTDRKIIAFYGERAVWWLKLVANGPTGHGSRFIEGTAMEKLMCSINQLFSFRDDEYKRLHGLAPHITQDIGCEHAKALLIGDVVTLNLTVLEGGVKAGSEYSYNVIPTTASAGFDFRIPPHINLKEFEQKIKDMLPEGVELQFYVKTEINNTSPHTADNKYWNTLMTTCQPHGIVIDEQVFSSATDCRYLRQIGIPSIGFSPLFNQPMMLHDHDERLNKWIFIKGLKIMTDVFKGLTDLD